MSSTYVPEGSALNSFEREVATCGEVDEVFYAAGSLDCREEVECCEELIITGQTEKHGSYGVYFEGFLNEGGILDVALDDINAGLVSGTGKSGG